MTIFLSILLFAAAIFLIVAVLLQSGKSKGVSGAITGGSSDTYFGKNKGKSFDKKLSMITTIVAIVFVVLAIVVYVTQDYKAFENPFQNTNTTSSTGSSTLGSGSGSNDVQSGVNSVNSGTNDVQSTTPSTPSNDVQSK